MTPEELFVHLDQQAKEIIVIDELWRSLLPMVPCAEFQFRTWLDLHTFDVCVYGIRAVARKFHSVDGAMDDDHVIRFASKCMNVRQARLAGLEVKAA